MIFLILYYVPRTHKRARPRFIVTSFFRVRVITIFRTDHVHLIIFYFLFSLTPLLIPRAGAPRHRTPRRVFDFCFGFFFFFQFSRSSSSSRRRRYTHHGLFVRTALSSDAPAPQHRSSPNVRRHSCRNNNHDNNNYNTGRAAV